MKASVEQLSRNLSQMVESVRERVGTAGTVTHRGDAQKDGIET
jgi:hypothetical protein